MAEDGYAAPEVPMIDNVIFAVPHPNHPIGLRDVGEVPVVATLAAIGNAVGMCPRSLPMSPPKLPALIESVGT